MNQETVVRIHHDKQLVGAHFGLAGVNDVYLISVVTKSTSRVTTMFIVGGTTGISLKLLVNDREYWR